MFFIFYETQFSLVLLFIDITCRPLQRMILKRQSQSHTLKWDSSSYEGWLNLSEKAFQFLTFQEEETFYLLCKKRRRSTIYATIEDLDQKMDTRGKKMETMNRWCRSSHRTLKYCSDDTLGRNAHEDERYSEGSYS